MALVNFESINAQMALTRTHLDGGRRHVVIFGLLNAIGVEIFGKVEVVLTFGMWTTLTIFGLCGIFMAPVTHLSGWFGTPLNVSDINGLFGYIGMAMFMFVGLRAGDADGAGDQTGPPHHTAGDGAGPAEGRQLHVYLRRGDQPPGGEYTVLDAAQQRPSAGYTDGDPGLRRTGDGPRRPVLAGGRAFC